MLNPAEPAHVLIVEDETFIALMLQQELENLGFSVRDIATTDAGAQACLSQYTPDLVILDYNLGRETSHGIARQLNDLNVPYILCTAAERDAAKNPNVVPVGILSKPIDFALLKNLVARAVAAKVAASPAQAA